MNVSPARKSLFINGLVENPWHRQHIRDVIHIYIPRRKILLSEEKFIYILLPILFLKGS